MQKLVAPFGKSLLIGSLIIMASFFYLYQPLFFCESIRFSAFRAGGKNLYLSPGIRPSQYKRIKHVLAQAEMRIDSFYNGKESRPVVIVCSTPAQYQKYCQSTEGAGCSLGSPWGSSYVILTVQGFDIDVVSHEMSHVELLKRLGWWKVTAGVPQWFNEGLALMLDRRFVHSTDPVARYLDYMDEWLYYTRGGQEILELNDITSIKGFFNGNPRQVMLAYMTSGLEVSYWMAFAGEKGLRQMIHAMNNGKSFPKAYLELERSPAAKRLGKLPRNPLRTADSRKISE